MTPSSDYVPQIGDLVQYTGVSEDNHGQIGVITGRTVIASGYLKNHKRGWLYQIQFPSGLWNLKPHHFKVIKKYEKNT
jgi:hypothetical protein